MNMWQKLFAGISLFLMACSTPAIAKNRLCDSEGYSCYRVKAGQSWQGLFEDPTDRGIVMRINRSNRALYAGTTIAIPTDLNTKDILDFSPLYRQIEPTQEKTLVFDPKQHAFGAYDENGKLVRWGPATGGGQWCKDIESSCRTRTGSFRIYSVGNSDCVSSKFPVPDGGAPMPYCMFFNGGEAFHGSPGGVVKGNESHGCIRLFVQDAEWLRYDFIEGPTAMNHFKGTKVIILPYAEQAVLVSQKKPEPQAPATEFEGPANTQNEQFVEARDVNDGAPEFDDRRPKYIEAPEVFEQAEHVEMEN